MTQRDTKATIEWYQTHETASQIGFNPDGMCLKVCRTARNIGSMFPSALAAQQATPEDMRVHKVSNVQRGMIAFFDDPNDSNPYGHIVTVVGRDKDRDPDTLGSLWTRTNSVKSGRVVTVRGDYFQRYWGDEFQFAATWLNGIELDLPERKVPKPKPPLAGKGERVRAAIGRLEHGVDALQVSINYHKRQGNDRLVRALQRDLTRMKRARQHLSEVLTKFS